MSGRVLHFLPPTRSGNWTACGVRVVAQRSTSDPARVTCKRCRRWHRFPVASPRTPDAERRAAAE